MRERVQRKVYELLEKRFIRYVIAAGIATVVDILVYFLAYGYLFTVDQPYLTITPDVVITRQMLAILLSYHCGLVVNFVISKFYVFGESDLRTRTQFVRFWLVAEIVFVANYLMARLLWSIVPYVVQGLPESVDALIVRTLSAGLIAVFSFLLHRAFSFEVKRVVAEIEETEAEGPARN
ncbi:MAG: GtrA family protein [Bacteroidetes bacterium]|jgi:putative flippase GtrA|nr:GtrA family protein [Bacteroidota bacterium]